MAITARAGTAPVITGLPSITVNPPVVGQVVTAVAAPVSGTGTITRTLEWKRDGATISGQTGTTYTLVSADAGTRITVTQTETSIYGVTTATSTATSLITEPGSAITGNIIIVNRRATQSAPEAVTLMVDLDSLTNAGVSGPGGADVPAGSTIFDPRIHYLDYVIDWGDDALETFTASADHVPLAKRNANITKSYMGTHVYREGGTYTPTITVTNPATGATGTLSTTITVATRAAAHPVATNTIIIGSGLAAAYPGATQVADLNAAITACRGASTQGTPRRIALEGGSVHTLSVTTFSSSGIVMPTTHIFTHSGAKAEISRRQWNWNDSNGTVPKDLIFEKVILRGDYNAETNEQGGVQLGSAAASSIVAASAKPPQQVLLLDCELVDCGAYVGPNQAGSGAPTSEQNWILYNTKGRGHGQYGIIAGVNLMAHVGCSLAQLQTSWTNALAVVGRTAYGEMRCAKFNYLIQDRTEYYCRLDIGRNQPALRTDSDGYGGNRLVLQDCYIEGGSQCLATGTEQTNPANAGNWIVRRNYFMGTWETNQFINFDRPCISFESNIGVVPNISSNYNNFERWWNTGVTSNVVQAQGDVEPIIHQGNTFYSLRSLTIDQPVPPFLDLWAPRNNAYYTPTSTGDGPFTVSSTIGPPFELGHMPNANVGDYTPEAATVTPTGSAVLPVPQAGAGALSSIVGTVATRALPYRDFNGDVHTGDFRGALPEAA